MIQSRVYRYPTVLKDFVYTVYTPFNVSRLLEKASVTGLAKLYIEECVKHGANLYKELNAIDIVLNATAPRYLIIQSENFLTNWMRKIINERIKQEH